eukprot:COSAG02_NODE_454_length_22024_cov_9.538518_6_plen_160_part_00
MVERCRETSRRLCHELYRTFCYVACAGAAHAPLHGHLKHSSLALPACAGGMRVLAPPASLRARARRPPARGRARSHDQEAGRLPSTVHSTRGRGIHVQMYHSQVQSECRSHQKVQCTWYMYCEPCMVYFRPSRRFRADVGCRLKYGVINSGCHGPNEDT